ncbi:hypothetical protein A8E97_06755 [Burkholderia cenocepacia]|nr:hypothetical protein A8E88_26590 [Burkholderia cenocepacia]ONV84153.1 hypothetical protein A8E89_26835 [Burkholderia cenocepacia]ONW07585.1 hypothetical protein A8E94_27105 [Burkholderia cenocepacia]ONW18493.1 hypothetical protein A8E90_13450 [Burkholderia cenocepacia]ONW34062.1 hypothetical protein A8E93_27175 [Burkholderia cenocepacia]
MSTRLGAITYYTYRDNMRVRWLVLVTGGTRVGRDVCGKRNASCCLVMEGAEKRNPRAACRVSFGTRQKKRGRGGRVNTRRLLRTKETSNCETKCSERPRMDSEAMLQRSLPGSGSLPDRAPIDYHQG